MKNLLLGFDKDKNRVYMDEETRSWHMHVIGATGTGKSKFLEWMIRGDIINNSGLCLIDPHGDLYEEILQWCCYQGFVDSRQIILLNPSAGGFVTCFNPFLRDEGEIDAQVNRRIQVTLKAWGMERSDQTPTLERWLRCIYWTLIEKNLSIVEAQYLIDFERAEVIEHLTAGLSNPLIANQWQSVKDFRSSKEFRSEFLSTFNRLFRLVTSPHLMNFMGQLDHNINLAEIMDSGKILLVNLKESDKLDGLNARLFGTLLVNQLFETAKRRTDAQASRRPFYLYIDEFQNYATPDIEKMLAQCRKMGLHLILSHQNLSQVAKEMDVDALLTNARTKVVFGGLNRKDATTMVEEMFVNQLDLQEMKEAVTQTKFWPVYGRDQVITRGTSSTSTGGRSSGRSTGSGWTSGTSQVMPEGFFEQGTRTDFTSSGFSESRVESESEGWAETESEAVADIPIYRPVPFEEPTETYSLEEQKWRMADALKEQWARHCFIKIGNEKTQPMLVPLVRQPQVFKYRIEEYIKKLMEKSPYSLPEAEARRLIEERQKSLFEKVSKALPEPGDEGWGVESED